jgi:two-component system LytT family response regulator
VIRALIADDEELSLRALHQMLRRHADVEVVAECRDGDEAREALEAHRPDVAFLDIRMPLASGLDLALSRDRGVQTLVVFVTAFDQFALPAFDADAADYLTKPLTEARFDAAIERVRQRVLVRRAADEGTTARAAGSRRQYLHQLVTRVGQLDVIIPIDAIDYIEADDVYAP